MASGGKREGSGRKPVSLEEKRVQMIITISPETRDKLKSLSKKTGIASGRLIDKMVQDYEEE